MKKTEYELVELAKAHDESALSALYEMTYRRAYASVRRMLNNDDDAQDVLQDAYITAYTHLDTLKDAAKFQAWLCRIAMNRCKDFLKKKKPTLFTDIAGEDGTEPDFEDDRASFSPEQQIDYTDTINIFDRIFDSLPEEQRLCILMFYRDEMSVSEIAETLNISQGTVKSRLNYGRQKIRAQVEDMEKTGVKLYGAMPFLAWMLSSQATETAANIITKAWHGNLASAAAPDATAGAAGMPPATSGASVPSAVESTVIHTGSLGKAAGLISKIAAHKLATGIVAIIVAASAVTGGIVFAQNKPDESGKPGAAAAAITDLTDHSQPTVSDTETGAVESPAASGAQLSEKQDELDMLAAYYQVLKDKIDELGTMSASNDKGVGHAALIDFDGDGTEELFIYYKGMSDLGQTNKEAELSTVFEIWKLDGSLAHFNGSISFKVYDGLETWRFVHIYQLNGLYYFVASGGESPNREPMLLIDSFSDEEWKSEKIIVDNPEAEIPESLHGAQSIATYREKSPYSSENTAQLQTVLSELKNSK